MSEKIHSPTVVDGKVMRTSVSALQKAHRCPRAYHYRYVQKLPEKESQGLITGTQAHARMAHFLLTGEDVLSPMERVGLARGLIPSKEELVAVNYPLSSTAQAEGIPLVGEIDALACLKETPNLLTVIDWKFKKDIEKWGVTEEELASPDASDGIQMLGYAATLAEDEWRLESAFELRHVTFATRGAPDAKPTSAVVTRDDVLTKWGAITSKLVPVMRQAAAASDARDVPQNLDACESFGGCPYKIPCLDRGQGIKNLFADIRSTLKGSTKMAGIFDGLDDIPSTPAPQAAPSKPYEGVLPPDAPVSNPALAAKLDDAPKPVEPSVPQTESQMVEALEASINQLPKRGRGRPKKEALPEPVKVQLPPPAENPRQHPQVTPEPQGVARSAYEVPPSEPLPAAPSAKPGAFTLYFGCSPIRIPTQTLGAYVEALDEALRKAGQLNCPDIRTTTAQDFSFGKWRGYLAKLALETPPAPGHYVVTRGDERVEVVAEALMEIAELVVIGGGR